MNHETILILDFGGNVLRHGPGDQIIIKDKDASSKGGEAPAKECPECHAIIAAGYSACPECGYEFPTSGRTNHDPNASSEAVLSEQILPTRYEVRDVFYSVHEKRGADENAPKTMRVDYRVGFHQYKPEWICFEHKGYVRTKAEWWWRARSNDPVPATAQEAVDIANAGGLAPTKAIMVRAVPGNRFDDFVDYEIGEKPEALSLGESRYPMTDDIPF